MAQAGASNTTTRRRFVTTIGIAAATIAAAPADAIAGSIPSADPLLDVERQLIVAHDKVKAAEKLVEVCEKTVSRWEDCNPEPRRKKGELSVWSHGIDEILRKSADPDAVLADIEAKDLRHRVAVAKWKKRREAACKKAGLDIAEPAVDAADEEVCRLEEFLLAPSASMAGLQAKARCALRFNYLDVRELVVRELVQLAV